MGGKWERKENGEGKGSKEKHFPLLDRRENGRGKKVRNENSVDPMPHFPPTFPSQSGKILGQFILFPLHALARCSHVAMLTKSSLLPHLTGSIDLASTHHEILRSSCLLSSSFAQLVIVFSSYAENPPRKNQN